MTKQLSAKSLAPNHRRQNGGAKYSPVPDFTTISSVVTNQARLLTVRVKTVVSAFYFPSYIFF